MPFMTAWIYLAGLNMAVNLFHYCFASINSDSTGESVTLYSSNPKADNLTVTDPADIAKLRDVFDNHALRPLLIDSIALTDGQQFPPAPPPADPPKDVEPLALTDEHATPPAGSGVRGQESEPPKVDKPPQVVEPPQVVDPPQAEESPQTDEPPKVDAAPVALPPKPPTFVRR